MTEIKEIKVPVDFKGGSYSVLLEAALCAIRTQEVCGFCGKAVSDPQNAVRILEVITIDSDEGTPIVDHEYFTKRVYGFTQPFPVGLEIARLLQEKLGGKCVCQGCRDALVKGIWLSG